MANNTSDDELLKDIVIVFDNRFGGQFSQDPVIHTRSSWAKKIDAYREQYGAADDKISEQFTVLPCEKHTVLDELIKQREEQVTREARIDEVRSAIGIWNVGVSAPNQLLNRLAELEKLTALKDTKEHADRGPGFTHHDQDSCGV